MTPPNHLPRGFTAIGIFLLFGATAAGFAGVTLVWPGTMLDRIWALNPLAYKVLAPMWRGIGISFLLLAMAFVVACRGWFLRRHWGWVLTVAIISTQVLGDLVNAIRGELLKGGTGFVIAGALLLYLLRPTVRVAFRHNSEFGSR